jgi:hypothetical protein
VQLELRLRAVLLPREGHAAAGRDLLDDARLLELVARGLVHEQRVGREVVDAVRRHRGVLLGEEHGDGGALHLHVDVDEELGARARQPADDGEVAHVGDGEGARPVGHREVGVGAEEGEREQPRRVVALPVKGG